ncbi:DUF402 domain-containing protein [Gaiella sp.]|jgi:hypothetical protein|uniref:DUF402 domain-containing protein n=1 Tax=Gaiella sp. TaxID=2663207 RepID=UPI002E30D705|nr:DUF402 domain-containing protein [Gaiella sp.]HEX5582171.1 DUF402 domain-containing protein [Gaiella sp.]
MQPGETALLRSVYQGRVRWTFAHRFVAEKAGRVVLYCGPGNGGKAIARDTDGRYLERWARGDDPVDATWGPPHSHVLRLLIPGASHMLELSWDETWSFLGWYVNLQTPVTRTALGWDMTDLALDLTVTPDGIWAWKDEDDLAEAIALGVLSAGEAGALRREGERVLAARPWPTGWETWRPPPAWGPLPLPDGWDRVPEAA